MCARRPTCPNPRSGNGSSVTPQAIDDATYGTELQRSHVGFAEALFFGSAQQGTELSVVQVWMCVTEVEHRLIAFGAELFVQSDDLVDHSSRYAGRTHLPFQGALERVDIHLAQVAADDLQLSCVGGRAVDDARIGHRVRDQLRQFQTAQLLVG